MGGRPPHDADHGVGIQRDMFSGGEIEEWELIYYFQPDLDLKKIIAIMIAIENRLQINQTVIYFFNQTLIENFSADFD